MRNFILFCTWCFTSIMMAQAPTHGKGIVEDADGIAVEGVRVFDTYTRKQQFTNHKGVFHFVNRGQKFIFTRTGFIKKITTLSHDSCVSVRLTSNDQALKEAVVTHKDRGLDMRKLRDVEDMTINAGRKSEVVILKDMLVNKTTNNARQIFSKVVGLTIDEGSDGGLQLNIGGRGLNPNRSANFNTRQNLYDISADVLGYPESYYTPVSNGVKEIQIIRGAASLQYGTQFGGMVNFKMNTPDETSKFSPHLLLSYGSHNLMSSFVDAGGRLGKFSYYAYYDYKGGNGYRPNSRYRAHNAFVNLNYDFNDNNRLQLDWVKYYYLAKQPGGLTDYMFYTNPKQSNRGRNWFKVDWNILNLRYEHKFTPNTRLSVDVFGMISSRSALGFRSYRVADADVVKEPRDLLIGKFRNWGSEMRFIHNYLIKGRHNTLLVGAKYYQSHNLSEQGPADSTAFAHFHFKYDKYKNYPKVSNFTYPNLNFALFAENIFHLNARTTLTPGFRLEKIKTEIDGYYDKITLKPNGLLLSQKRHNDYNKKDRYVPLLGVGFSHKQKSWEIYANLSQNYRSVTFSDIHSVTPGFSISPTISDEKGFSSDAGIRGHLKNIIQFDTSIYGLYYGDKIGEYYRINPNYQTVERYRDNVGTALTYGLETMLNWNVSGTFFPQNNWTLSTFINTSFTGSRYLKSDIPNIKGHEVEFVPMVNLRYGIEGGYKGFKSNLLLTYVSRQFSDAGNQPQRRDDNRNGIFGAIPAYYVLDLNMEYTFNKHIRLSAALQNLTDHSYFTRRATGYPGPGIIPSDRFNCVLTLGLTL